MKQTLQPNTRATTLDLDHRSLSCLLDLNAFAVRDDGGAGQHEIGVTWP